jgi:hypothetical protein
MDMTPDPQNKSVQSGGEQMPAADYGNASNPSPHNSAAEPPAENQLLDERAEKYLREVASIEDVPDAQDQQDMDETIEQAKAESKKE